MANYGKLLYQQLDAENKFYVLIYIETVHLSWLY